MFSVHWQEVLKQSPEPPSLLELHGESGLPLLLRATQLEGPWAGQD
jgi:hypothetical protein